MRDTQAHTGALAPPHRSRLDPEPAPAEQPDRPGPATA
jgi:hypothetical protein